MHQISSENAAQIPALGSVKYSWFCVLWNGSLAKSISKQTHKMHNCLHLSGKYDVFGNVPCIAVVDTKNLSLQVRGQNDDGMV